MGLAVTVVLKAFKHVHPGAAGLPLPGLDHGLGEPVYPDCADPGAADLPNQALNHASSAVEGAAAIAVAATATIPQLGFIHEDPGQSFVLDIADLYRDSVTIPCAFRAAKRVAERPDENVERVSRRMTGETLAREQVIPAMIERIKSLFEERPE